MQHARNTPIIAEPFEKPQVTLIFHRAAGARKGAAGQARSASGTPLASIQRDALLDRDQVAPVLTVDLGHGLGALAAG